MRQPTESLTAALFTAAAPLFTSAAPEGKDAVHASSR